MLRIFNSLGRELQEFEPIEEGKVGMYTCGPTVYDFVTIGNWRTYTLGDLVVRSLKYLGFEVTYIMNITDVGHLTGDNLGDADTGEDRLEKASKKEGKTAWEIAEFYAKDFLAGYDKMNLTQPLKFTKATEYIQEQVSLVQQLEEKGYAYKISDGIYFDVQKFEEDGHKYGELSNLDNIKEGARVEPNPEKKDPRDFALWKFSKPEEKRHMEWESPWGIGFPGWHIECSAMSMKYLGPTFDIHIGGEDLKSTHHPNEIAQSEGATGKKFVNYWLHGAFLKVDGGRMGKSLGNAYNLKDIEDRGYLPMHLRYFYLQSHYRSSLNFTWDVLEASKRAYDKLAGTVAELKDKNENIGSVDINYQKEFIAALENDFNIPQSLSVLWDVVKSNNLSDADKLATILDFDRVFGLRLDEVKPKKEEDIEYSEEVKILIEERNKARENKDWETADKLRDILKEKHSIEVKDTK